jgi:hypothetical protein
MKIQLEDLDPMKEEVEGLKRDHKDFLRIIHGKVNTNSFELLLDRCNKFATLEALKS